MRKNLLLFAALVVNGLCCVAHAEDYLMPQWGYETKSVSKDAPVTFYDFKGEDDIPSSSSSNSYSTVVFTPADEGCSISVSFEYVDVSDDGAGWVSYLDVFDGVFDKSLVNGGEYPSSVGSNTTPFKDYATPLKHYENGTFSNESFVSGSSTGALSVCFHYRYAARSRGWKATVTAVKLEDMTVSGAKGDNSDVDTQVWADKKNVEVAGFVITTEGYSSPDKLKSITFTCSNEAVVNPLAVNLYAGMAASVSSLAKIEGDVTENAGVYTYTLTTPYAFCNGDNKFCIVADILSSALFNAEAEVNVTGIATVGGFTDYTPATAAKLTVQPMYNMATDATFTIGQQVNFYDEGGPDGKVIKGFDGKTVFAPATEGEKVVLTFNTIDVFYTDYAAGSTGYVDYIKVYNGNSTADADLLWEISQATASSTSDIVIRSTASDGKLTITHKCNVSYDSNLKSGWTASSELLIPKQKGSLVSAAPIATVTTDITGKERALTPTIGAYEYDDDSFRIPVLAEGYPKTENIKDVEADVVVKADNFGTAYVLVLTSDIAVPTVETVISDGEELTLSKNAEVSVNIKNLNEETTYKAYVVTASPLGETATDVAASEEFTTLWTLRPVELNVIPAQTVEMGADVAMTVTLVQEYEQAKPYVYSWRTAFSNVEIGNEATLNVSASNSTEYICSVTDKFGQFALISAHVLVTKSADVATFEEYNLAEGEHKMVDDAWIDNVETNLYSGTFAFANLPNKSWKAYSGYVISADHSSDVTGDYNVDQYRSAAGGSYEGDNFAVAYYSAPSDWFAGYNDPITFTNSDEAQTVSGFYITNSAYTLDAILNGDYASGPFSQGDYYRLTITGYNGNDKTNDVVFYLADYRSEDATEHFAIDTWEWVDLSELGAVTRIEFDLFTTKSDSHGFTTPTYFCLDNFGGEAPVPTSVPDSESSVKGAYKIMENGVIYIVRPDGVRYDLFGRRVK